MIPAPDEEGWQLRVRPTVLLDARAAVDRHYPADPENKDVLQRLERFLGELQKRPLKIWEHQPRRTDSADAYRLPADPKALVSAYADVIVSKKVVMIIKIHIRPPHLRHDPS